MREFIKIFSLSFVVFTAMFVVIYLIAYWLQVKITFVASMVALIISGTTLAKITLRG